MHKKWKSWLAASRYCYNKAISALKAGEQITSGYSLRDYIFKADLPTWVADAPAHPKENAIFDAWDAWNQAKAAKGEASFRSCRQPSQAIKFHCRNFNGKIWFPALTKGLTFRTSESLPNTEFATQLVRDRRRWFACIPILEQAEEPKELDKVIALDPGVRTFLTGYDGDSFQEFCKADIGRIQRLCSHLDQLMSKISKAKGTQKRRMVQAANRLRIKVRNLVDECHKQVANYLTCQYKIILLPTFETSQMVVKSKRKLHTITARQMLTWGHYRFERHLKQVAAKRGVVVIDVNESYTSKTCTKCGHKHSKLGGAKIFKCPNCGHEHDRDWGGARNIMIRALRDGSFSLAISSQRIAIAFALFIQGCPA